MTDTIINDIANEVFLHVEGVPTVTEITREDFVRYASKAKEKFDDLTCDRWRDQELPKQAMEYMVAEAELKFLNEVFEQAYDIMSYTTDALKVVHDSRYELTKELFRDPLHFDPHYLEYALCPSELEMLEYRIKRCELCTKMWLAKLAEEVLYG